MDEFLTLEWAYSYSLTLYKARHLTDKEKVKYKNGLQDKIFVALGDRIKLDDTDILEIEDILGKPANESDGMFTGCSNQAYIISREQWDKLVELDNENRRQREQKEKQKDIDFYTDYVKRYESNQLYKLECEFAKNTLAELISKE